MEYTILSHGSFSSNRNGETERERKRHTNTLKLSDKFKNIQTYITVNAKIIHFNYKSICVYFEPKRSRKKSVPLLSFMI